MASLNKVILLGNLTRDPEMRFTQKGGAIANIGLALNRKWKDQQSNEMKEEVSFVDLTAFGKTADIAAKFLKKGNPVLCEGRLRTETWDDKQSGAKRSKLGVIVESLVLLGGGKGQGAGVAEATASEPAAASETTEPKTSHPKDDDVPF